MRPAVPAGIVLALAVLALGGCGGATKERCGKTLLTGKICGDDLVAWCQDRYDPTLNGEACAPALRDAGQDPDEVLAAIKATEKAKAAEAAEQDKAAASEAEQDARVTIASGSPGELGDVTMTVTEPDYRQKVGNAYSTQRAKSGRRFAILRVVIHNDGDEPLSARLLDTARRPPPTRPVRQRREGGDVRVRTTALAAMFAGVVAGSLPATASAKHCPYVPRSPLTHLVAERASCTTAQAVAVGWFKGTSRDQHRRKWACRVRYIDDARVAVTCRRSRATITFRSARVPD